MHGPGSSTSDSVHARLSAGEYVMQASSAVDHYGRAIFDALNARQFAAGGPVSISPGRVPAQFGASGGGGLALTLNSSHHIELKVGSQVLASTWRTEQMKYNRRNNAPNTSLRIR